MDSNLSPIENVIGAAFMELILLLNHILQTKSLLRDLKRNMALLFFITI